MNIKKSLLCLFAAAAVLSCQKTPQVEVEASFATDKETYEVYDPIVITNTTVVKHSRIAVCKWEYNGKVSYAMPAPDNIVFETVGTYPITLTVTSEEGAVKGTFTKEIKVQDSNPHPVVDFTWNPTEVIAGEEVQFTASATDADGIASYEWTFGTTKVDEENPKFTFKETGDIMVTLKVTDNAKRTSSVTKTITVERGVNYLDLIWEKSYDTVADAYVYGTSPALNADGSRIYVHSTGYHLVAFDNEGNQQWSFDTSVEGASALSNSGSIKNQSPTPSVDENGNVFIAVSFDEPKTAKGGLFAVKPDGTRKWYTHYGDQVSFRFMSPMIFGNYVATNQRNTGKGEANEFNQQNFVILDKESGSLVSYHYCDSGPLGGIAAMPFKGSWLLFAQQGDKYGTRVYYPTEPAVWNVPSEGNTNSRPKNLANGQTPKGTQIGISNDGNVYTLYSKNNKDAEPILYCHDMSAYEYDATPVVKWSVDLVGNAGQIGCGCVVAEDGTVYVTLKNALYAINPADGSIKWKETPDGEIRGVAAIDNAGAVYYNDSKNGKLIKVTPEGKRVVELSLAEEMRTSPTIGPDGTIYCTGIKGGQPTLFCVKGSATGHANSWSQLGANPCKTGTLTVK